MGRLKKYSKKNLNHQILLYLSIVGLLLYYYCVFLFSEQELITILLCNKISENIFKREKFISKGFLA